ncbi:BirA family transcriptional regulator, biotin operon repressor / biotin-[acetyl-CoA-carboxylase] ligase [Sinomicrobium oceani]|uniref:BirA family transcriptional regulator, biotin operon repressor / biotin-[acetyl-CoA-carboxylase] ligase n=1 Tax=Sinomicrobium oceani TaxID=1150368 RepID=A0A1K1RNY0_9FLAO|nr:biotin--[acetyl-CoA-carboxylase] ligase [Sinomicrobium oceani]SFW73549.1 BirA family transcriptional regulator, biotin operon repressor / biotin-[acetyl-CoA-carboxylase] ligase [Sinomicrobium oceani]
MHIIKLNAIDSTNSYLKELSASGILHDYTVVMTREQTRGRGQMGTVWNSHPGKNLTFSVYKKISCIRKEEIFSLSMATSLAIVKALKKFNIPGLRIKWPNDILSANKKVCGVLIESIIKKGELDAAVIGMGLNVNQTDFGGLPHAGSLKQITGVTYNLDELMHAIVKELQDCENFLAERKLNELKLWYEKNLFRRDKPSTFADKDGGLFMGFIRGVSDAGKLILEQEDAVRREYDLKEVRLMY